MHEALYRTPRITKLAILCCITLTLASCSPTVTRPEVHQRQPSWTATGQDSGILSEPKDLGGFVVNSDWIAGYDSLLLKYGQTLSPARKPKDRDGIKAEGDHFRISDAVMERQQAMNQRRVNDQAP
jgi:hypothetical protein